MAVALVRIFLALFLTVFVYFVPSANACSSGCVGGCPVGFDACCTYFCASEEPICYEYCMNGNYGARRLIEMEKSINKNEENSD